MNVGDVQRLVARVAAVDASSADRLDLEVVAGELRSLKSWVESREVVVARALREVSSFPEKNLADATRTNLREAERVMRRAKTLEAVPPFEAALDSGRVSGDHLDVLDRVLRGLEMAITNIIALNLPTREQWCAAVERGTLKAMREHLRTTADAQRSS